MSGSPHSQRSLTLDLSRIPMLAHPDRLLMRRRATIAESVTLVRGVQTWGTPKGHERQEVPIPRFLVDDLAAHVAGREPGRWCSPP